VFTVRYRLIPYIKQISFRFYKVNRSTNTQIISPLTNLILIFISYSVTVFSISCCSMFNVYINTYFICIISYSVKIYRNIFLFVVYGCETWSLTLSEGRRLRVFENMVSKRIFWPKKDEVTGVWRKLYL
jgi:hypothetical protein